MKNKLIFISTIIFFVLIFASSAYGADNDQSVEDSSIANYVVESSPSIVYINPVTGNDTNNGTSPDSPLKTINKGISTVADGGTVNLSAGTYQENVITVNKNLTITGAGEDNTILDGKNNNRVFYIDSGKTVTIQNLTITRGIGKPDGGGIYNDGTLTLNSCKLYSNTTPNGRNANKSDDANPGGNGGAIYNTSNGNLTINNCEIYNNKTGNGGNACSHLMDRGSAEHGGYGGAIYNSGIIKLQNSNIYGNIAGKGGHSSDVHPGAHGGHGGAIYNNKNAQLTITNCTITSNKAGEGGKRDNTCNTTSGDGGNGGAIYNDGILKISGTKLEKNRAGESGTVTDDGQSVYDGNGGNGGAIYNDDDGQLTIENSILTKNNAGMAGYKHSGGNGGAINNHGVLNITESEISQNRAGSDLINGPESKDISYGKGNGIYSDCEKTVKINFCSIVDNRTIYLNKNKDVIWYNEEVYLKEYKSTDTDLKNNWWGTNNDNGELANLVKGKDDITKYYNPYLKLTITVDPTTIELDGTSNVTASLRINSAGENTYVPYDWMHVPDCVEVKFSSYKGSVELKNITTTSGIANTTFLPTREGDAGKPGVVYAT
ncbi:MAG: DUF1565 domain-containing protein, partial [Methanobacterium sp.]|nr:DUF1565 domain-containing protein [Methanobacterium sp.]